MDHHILHVAAADKNAVVRELASGQGRALLFTRTKHGARRLARQLTAAGIPTVDLHGNLSQGARERNLAAFTSGDVRVLAATDIAARGIHVDEIELVVHVDPPAEHARAPVARSSQWSRPTSTAMSARWYVRQRSSRRRLPCNRARRRYAVSRANPRSWSDPPPGRHRPTRVQRPTDAHRRRHRTAGSAATASGHVGDGRVQRPELLHLRWRL
jgi:superfamily II DNA/RNA helicase